MKHTLEKNKNYIFNINNYFDIVYFNGFVVKSKRYDFSIGRVVHSESKELIEILKSYKFEGSVLFDLFSPNGFYAENRFFEFNFDGEKFNKKGNIVHIISPKEMEVQDRYYRNNYADLRDSILEKSEIEEFKNLKYDNV